MIPVLIPLHTLQKQLQQLLLLLLSHTRTRSELPVRRRNSWNPGALISIFTGSSSRAIIVCLLLQCIVTSQAWVASPVGIYTTYPSISSSASSSLLSWKKQPIVSTTTWSTTQRSVAVVDSPLEIDSPSNDQSSVDDNDNNDIPVIPFTQSTSIDILLNNNAKGVTSDVVDVVQALASQYSTDSKPIRVHVTNTQSEAAHAVQEIVNNQSGMIIPIGGDGTLTALLQLLLETQQQQQTSQAVPVVGSNTTGTISPRRFPHIAYIAMGTGNALGSVVGCRPPKIQGRLHRWANSICRRPRFLGGTNRKLQILSETISRLLEVSGDFLLHNQTDTVSNEIDIVELPLLQVTTTTIATTKKKDDVIIVGDDQEVSDGNDDTSEEFQESSVCFFAGVGFDSLMLQDYKDLQEWTSADEKPHRRVFKESLSSVLGYCVALITRTLPQCVFDRKHLIHVEVSTTHPESTVWIDHRRGDVVRNVQGSGKTLLYRGEAGIVAVGSAPYYGGGLRLFPFARMTPSGMQLRIGRIHPLRGTVNIPRIFEGSYRDTRDNAFGCLDFMGSQFSVEILHPSQGYPVQHSGDFIGTTRKVDFSMIPTTLEPVRFVTLLPPRLVVEVQDDEFPTTSI